MKTQTYKESSDIIHIRGIRSSDPSILTYEDSTRLNCAATPLGLGDHPGYLKPFPSYWKYKAQNVLAPQEMSAYDRCIS
jgi:hypothetical protein